MAGWIKPVLISDVLDGKLYFVGLMPQWKYGEWQFWSEGLDGKQRWSVKPGIAVQCVGSDELRALLVEKRGSGVIAVEVPKDADKRWRKRRPRRG